MQATIVSQPQWRAARLALLEQERRLTRLRDEVNAQRRALALGKVEQEYLFDTPAGRRGLTELFAGRGQLLVQHFMLPPGADHVCEGCAFMADHVDAARAHFEHADLSFVAVSRAPLEQIEAVRQRNGLALYLGVVPRQSF